MTLEYALGGMTCLDCSKHITTALERVPGVVAAHVNYRAGRGRIELQSGVAPTAALEHLLIAAVERAGYRAEPVVAADSVRAGIPAAAADVAKPWAGRSDTPLFASEGLASIDRRPTDGHPTESAAPGAERTDGGIDFDLLIVGTGGAGVAAAIQAAGMGAKVAIVEGGTLGGTCVNVGCIPSKTLVEAAAHIHAARQGFPGVAPCAPAVDWREVVRQKDALVGDLREAKYADVLASYPGVARIRGHARLLGSADGVVRVRVSDGDQAAEYVARKVIVATGSTSGVPPLPGLDTVDALDSTSAMAMEALPASMIVVGGGPVGVELGQIFARFGVKVVIVQRGAHLLPFEDAQIAEVLREALEAEGIEIHTGTSATRVERAPDGVIVHVRRGSIDGEIRAERLLVATGRRPTTADLGLEDVGVALSPTGYVQTDETLRTANPNIYAAGDVTGGPAYVYVAAAGGRVAAENALKSLRRPGGSHGTSSGTPSEEPSEFDLSVVPSVTFTAPQVGSVGLTEAAARAAGHHVDVSVLEMQHVPRALVSHDRRGLVKLVSEASTGRILGVHAVAPNAGEMMGEATLAVRFGLTVRDLSGTLHPYLTWVESLKLAAQGGSAGVQKLSCCA